MKEISIKEMKGLSIGHAQIEKAKTGVTVIYFPDGAKVGCDISGGGPASRETTLASPLAADNPVNAVVLSGGSAYGLAASDGVMRRLEEAGIGYDTGYALVPLVCQSCIFDLNYGSARRRPDADTGYAACDIAMEECDDRMGSVGAGTGASVGKLLGMKQAQKSGIGMHAIQEGDLHIAAIVVVNAFGDIFDNGRKIAGLLDHNRREFLDSGSVMADIFNKPRDMFTGNTTIGCIVTNAKFNKAEMNKIASMARNAYARCIDPVGTMADGDTIYACSVGDIVSDINLVGMLSAKVMERAIVKAVEASRMDDEEFLANCR